MHLSKVRGELAELINKGSADKMKRLLDSVGTDQQRLALLLELNQDGDTALHQAVKEISSPEVSV